jgi:hypothetical protein
VTYFPLTLSTELTGFPAPSERRIQWELLFGSAIS